MAGKKISLVFVSLFCFVLPLLALAHEEGGDTIVIHMDENGFLPTEVTADVGTTIMFENIGTQDHWPASNLHPTHTLYPGSDIEKCGTAAEKTMFDACRGIKPGASYSFVFNDPGSWRFHDHLFPNFKGTIVITGSTTTASTTITITPEKVSVFKRVEESVKVWWMKTYFKLFPKQGEKKLASLDMIEVGKDDNALRYWLKIFSSKEMMLELLSDTGGGSTVDCHTQAHHLGRISFELNGAEAFAEGDPSCHSGFYHGAMETFLHEKGVDNLAQDIKDVCDTFKTSFGVFECLHGVGHGLMAYEDYDLPKSIADCKLLGDDFSASSCYGGVFMENIVAGQGQGALIGHETQWVSKDPHFPCNALDPKDFSVRYQCYQMQTSWMLTLFNYDFAHVATECLKASSDMVPVCFKSLGRDISGNSLRDPKSIVDKCEAVAKGEENHKQCIEGALNVVVDFWGDKLNDQATQVCKMVAADSKTGCYQVLAGRLPGVFSAVSDRQRICTSFEPAFQYLCQAQ